VKREPSNAGFRHRTHGHRQPERLHLVVNVAEERSAPDPDDRPRGVHPHPAHRREVNDESIVADRVAGHVVPAAPHRDRQPLLSGKADCGHDVRRTGAARDRRRTPVDHTVPDPTRPVVALVARLEDRATKALSELLDSFWT